MKIEWRTYNIRNELVQARVTILSPIRDRRKLRKLYNMWKKLNDLLKKISTRGINLPEAISENAFCLAFPHCVRVVQLKNDKCSYDCINTRTGSRIQIKASSVENDLTSFGPRSEWDELFFLDFSEGDGTFKIYKINPDWIYNHQINKSQTFTQQQEQGRRPRFSITKDIILERKLKPLAIYKL
jgi:hypothetical protein